jgi:ATP-dependent DNA helicase RecG
MFFVKMKNKPVSEFFSRPYLDKYEYASKEDIYKLILDILPDVLDKQQKENKVKNLIYAMHKKDETLVNKGTNRKPIWKKFV